MREKQAMQLHRNTDARARVRRCVFQINVPAGLDCFFLLVVFQLLMDPTFHRLIFPPNVPACLERTTPLESLLNRDGKAFRFIRRHVFFFCVWLGEIIHWDCVEIHRMVVIFLVCQSFRIDRFFSIPCRSYCFRFFCAFCVHLRLNVE